MKIGILTLPLHINYGGILQAYALQTVLERMGHEVYVINESLEYKLPIWKWPISYPKRMMKRLMGDKKAVLFYEKHMNSQRRIMSQYTERFIKKYIREIIIEKTSDLKKEQFDIIVVGSDQIWRPKYYTHPIEEAYLRFASNWNIRRIAYAASFGTDEWEYTKNQTSRCGELLKKFEKVSVRESSAVDLCRKYFGMEVDHVLDPTLLLEASDYEVLIKNDSVKEESGDLLCYVLDESLEKTNLINHIAATYNCKPFRSNSKAEDWNAPLEERIQPPLEQWLKGFRDAKIVVTDSFHACVFSIIFHKPFVVVGNLERGLARFQSLLSLFGLEHCLFDGNPTYKLKDIDWEKVDQRVDELKKNL